MKLTNLLKDHKYAVCLIGTWTTSAVILAGTYGMLHQPKKQELATINNQYAESKDMLVIANLAKRQDVRERLQEQLDEARQTVSRFSVSRDNTTGLVFEIGKIANELKLAEFASKDQTVRDVPTLKKNGTVTEAWLKVEFKSSFMQYAQFVNRLERQTPAVFIERMTFRRNEDDPQQNDVKMELSFLVKEDKRQSIALGDAATEQNETVN